MCVTIMPFLRFPLYCPFLCFPRFQNTAFLKIASLQFEDPDSALTSVASAGRFEINSDLVITSS